MSTKIACTLEDMEAEGQQAAQAGKSLQTCPYRSALIQSRASWHRGWRRGQVAKSLNKAMGESHA